MKNALSLVLLVSSFLVCKAQNHLVEANNKLAIDLYQKLKSDNSNLFFSPVSIDFALLVLHHGASGKTKEEFEQILHLEKPVSDVEKNNFLASHTKVIDDENLLDISNSLWINKRYDIRKDFKNAMQTAFSSEIRQIDAGKPAESSEEINSWVADKTNNRIKGMVKPSHIGPSTKLIVLNTVFFKGEWQTEFNKDRTSERKFYPANGEEKDLKFMADQRNLSYYENNDIQAIKIPYKEPGKTFCVLLPKKPNGIVSLEKILNTAYIDNVFKNMKGEKWPVKLYLPKFNLEKEYDLVGALQSLGLNLPFTNKASFSAISNSREPLTISQVIHKSFFEMDEKKTEAAAATETLIVVGYGTVKKQEPLPPKVFNANHPFIFMIMDDQTNEILFMGKYSGE